MTVSSVHFSSATDNWATPQSLFDELNAKYGPFTVDVCASAGNAKCEKFYDMAMDGLAQDWSGERFWMNPPYGRAIGHWMKKAHDSWRSGGASGVCLVPARTDTAWWHDHAAKGTPVFLRGRVRFGDGRGSAPFPSALVLFGINP